MSFFKSTQTSKTPPATPKDLLRQKRLAHEQAHKEAGVWGDMAVGQIVRENKVFLHHWKGHALTGLFALAGKKPREMTPAEHEALVAWLKSSAYEGFTQSLVAWNINEAEALRVKNEHLEKHRSNGLEVINPAAAK
jgi:hypothetical protein